MYEVMARRYRPAAFAEVVGQEHIAATLKNAILRDRVAHAYLFAGGHGCGKTTMARIMAKALVCDKGPTVDPCGVCSICLDVAAGRDSDVLEIDGASNNGIEQIRQLRDQAAYVPNRARYKIYIIDEAHMLSESAFNALLKILEEPPRHVKFILATTDPHKLPDTILSRCQRFDFRLVPQAVLAAFFRRLAEQEKTAISDEALEAVASFSGGSVRDGLVLLDQLLSFADGAVTREDVEAVRGVASTENVAGIFTAIAGADVAAALATVDRVIAKGINVGDFLDQLVSFGRDLMVLVATGSRDGIDAYGPAKLALTALAGTASLESAILYLDVLTQARTRVRARSLANPAVLLEMAVARLSGLGGITPVSRIIDKLETLPDAFPPFESAVPRPPAAFPDAEKKNNPPPPMLAPTAANPEPEAPSPPPEPEEDKPEPKNISAAVAPSAADAAQRWEAAKNLLAERHPADLRYLAKITLVGMRGGVLQLEGPALAAEALEDRRRRARLAEVLAAAFGRRLEFDVAVQADRPNAGAEADLRHRPVIEHIRNLFDGVIVHCEPAPGTAAPEADGASEGEN
ncbi:MAG: DNA polymerase III subunit gamma/tau [Planctomycetota bacterium]|nr:DNA polymerase III subunit gamma/tau [Planctomycetota bacterium]